MGAELTVRNPTRGPWRRSRFRRECSSASSFLEPQCNGTAINQTKRQLTKIEALQIGPEVRQGPDVGDLVVLQVNHLHLFPAGRLHWQSSQRVVRNCEYFETTPVPNRRAQLCEIVDVQHQLLQARQQSCMFREQSVQEVFGQVELLKVAQMTQGLFVGRLG